MAIGVFDSGVGGLTIHRALVDRFPQADFVFLGDQANVPYGGRPGEEIVELTREGCIRLFEAGADVAVLACNTAASIALRRLQQTWLPDYRAALGPAGERPLGLIVPTIEAATGVAWAEERERGAGKVEAVDVIGVFSTPGTTASRVYEIEIDKRRQDVAVFSGSLHPTLGPDDRGGRAARDPGRDHRRPYGRALQTPHRPPSRFRAIRWAAPTMRSSRTCSGAALPAGTRPDPSAERGRRQPGALPRPPPRVRSGPQRCEAVPNHRRGGRAERPGGRLLGRAAAVRGGVRSGAEARPLSRLAGWNSPYPRAIGRRVAGRAGARREHQFVDRGNQPGRPASPPRVPGRADPPSVQREVGQGRRNREQADHREEADFPPEEGVVGIVAPIPSPRRSPGQNRPRMISPARHAVPEVDRRHRLATAARSRPRVTGDQLGGSSDAEQAENAGGWSGRWQGQGGAST